MKKPKTEYALYKGDDMLGIGTIKELAAELGIKESTVRYYMTPTYKKRSRSKNTRVLVKLGKGDL